MSAWDHLGGWGEEIKSPFPPGNYPNYPRTTRTAAPPGERAYHGTSNNSYSNTESKDWDCPSCHISNFSTRAVCRRCRERKPDSEPDLKSRYNQTKNFWESHNKSRNNQSKGEDWNCSSCQFYNFAWRSNCRECKTPKPSFKAKADNSWSDESDDESEDWLSRLRKNKDRTQSNTDTGWKCSGCNTINFHTRFRCRSCGGKPDDDSQDGSKEEIRKPSTERERVLEEYEQRFQRGWGVPLPNKPEPPASAPFQRRRTPSDWSVPLSSKPELNVKNESQRRWTPGDWRVPLSSKPEPVPVNDVKNEKEFSYPYLHEYWKGWTPPRKPGPVPVNNVKSEEKPKSKPTSPKEQERQNVKNEEKPKPKPPPISLEEQIKQVADSLKTTADGYYKKGENQLAIRFYSRAIAIYPQNYICFLNRAAAFVKLDSFSGFYLALKDCEHVQKFMPSNVKAIGRILVCAAALGDWRKARVALLRMAQLKPTFWMEDDKDNSTRDLKKLADDEILKEAQLVNPVYANKVIRERLTLLKTLEEHTEEAKKSLRTATTTHQNVSRTEIQEAILGGLRKMLRVIEISGKHKGLTLGTFSLDSNVGSFSLEWMYLRCKFRYLAKEYAQIDKEVREMSDTIRSKPISTDEDNYDINSLTTHRHIAQLFNKRERRHLFHFSETEIDMLREMFKMQVHSNYLLMNFDKVLSPWITKDCKDKTTADKFVTDNSQTILLKFLDGLPLPSDVLNTFVKSKESNEILDFISLSTKLHFAKLSSNKEYSLRNFANAEEQYTQALEIDPKHSAYNSIIHYNRAAARRGLGKYKEAIEDCTMSIKFEPSYSKALLRRAESYDNIKRWTLAIADYKTYLASSPALTNADAVQEQMKKTQTLLESELESVRNHYKKMNHYERLGLTGKPPASDIKKAYHKQAVKLHPDKATEEDSAIVNERFVMVKESYEILISQKK